MDHLHTSSSSCLHSESRFIGSGRSPYEEACLDERRACVGVSNSSASLASIRSTILPFFFLDGASTKHPKQIIYKHTLINFTFSIEFLFLLDWLIMMYCVVERV